MPLPFGPSHRGPATTAERRPRRGFTIVEAIVAVVMLAAGVLALVSSSAVVLREMNRGSQKTLAAAMASQRLELLRSYDQCASIVAGTDTVRGIVETWQVDDQSGTGGQATRIVTYTVTGRDSRELGKFVTSIPCI